MRFIIPVESIVYNKGGVIMYDPLNNQVLRQYVHHKTWTRSGWRGGKIFGDYLIATDWTHLHYFNIPEWKYLKTFTKKTFNDLHYVEIHKNLLYIVNTGLDAIEIFTHPMNPRFQKMIFLFDKNKKFTKRDLPLNVKYNTMYKVKPHSCHPNCISFKKGKVFVTCFERDAILNTGEVIELYSGDLVLDKKFDCHDGNFYGTDFYLTRTRSSEILVYKDFIKKKWPVNPDQVIPIGSRGWWRGMIIHEDMLYLFSSDGYRKRKSRIRMFTLDLRTGKGKTVKLPVISEVYWDTVYQPNLYLR